MKRIAWFWRRINDVSTAWWLCGLALGIVPVGAAVGATVKAFTDAPLWWVVIAGAASALVAAGVVALVYAATHSGPRGEEPAGSPEPSVVPEPAASPEISPEPSVIPGAAGTSVVRARNSRRVVARNNRGYGTDTVVDADNVDDLTAEGNERHPGRP